MVEESYFLFEIIDSIARPLRIYYDNSNIIFFFKNNESGSCSKPIDIKNFAIKNHVKKQEVDIQYISIKFMAIDPRTKRLSVK